MAGPDGTTKEFTVPVLLILVPLGVHFLLVGFVLVFPWLPGTYSYTHLIFSAVGLWAAYDHKRILPVIVFLVVLAVTVLLDCVQLGIYFQGQQSLRGDGGSVTDRTWQFSAAMVFFNLLLKPVTGVLAGISIFLRTERGKSMQLFGHSRGNSSEEAPPTGSGYATIGSHVQPSGGYPSQYAQPVAAPVGPVVTDPRESVPHYEYDSQY